MLADPCFGFHCLGQPRHNRHRQPLRRTFMWGTVEQILNHLLLIKFGGGRRVSLQQPIELVLCLFRE